MKRSYKLYTARVIRRSSGDQDNATPQLPHNTSHVSTTELQQLPRQPSPAHLTQNSSLEYSDSDDIDGKPYKLATLARLRANLTCLVGGGRIGPGTTSSAVSKVHGQNSPLLDRFVALPPELQLKVLSYLDFGDIERLRRTCRFFHASVTPALVRALLAPDFRHHVRYTCRICLAQHWEGGDALVCTDQHDSRFPLSSRCVDCVWDAKGFDVGRKYLMGNNKAAFVCRWCGRPITTQPAWNRPEYHRQCFRRYTQAVLLYYFVGVFQWTVCLTASGMGWRYFRSRALWVVGVIAAGFVITVWNFALGAVRGTLIRTYHIGLVMESLIFASWFAPLLELFRISSRRTPSRGMDSYETAMLVFIIFNFICRGINIIGNTILLCEYKLWRHKKPDMSVARSVWVRTIMMFIFFVEPQCVELEYPGVWFRRRGAVRQSETRAHVVGVHGGSLAQGETDNT